MVSRYDNREIGINQTAQYENVLQKRGLKRITQHFTPELKQLTPENMQELDIIDERWDNSTRFYKLAHKWYGDSTKWWVIAWTNNRPTDAHMKIGDVVRVFLPLERVLNILDL